ncbi:MAG: ribonuclease III [Coriobacteriia bacterium]|nr:ribonuclease III [Coriobacteriia bacterium]
MEGTSQKRGKTAASKTAQYANRLNKAEKLLGYRFKDRELLLLALTHPSASEGNGTTGSYERLEFLGDAILGAIISRELYDSFPKHDEGALTRLKVSAVAGNTLSKLAEELKLEQINIFGSSERGTGKRGLQSALENVYEALVGALAIDGGMEEAERFVLHTLAPRIYISVAREPENPKSMLQELLQAHHVTPTYEIIDTDGPPHDRFFTARVLSDEDILATGTGHSKKDAEMNAATKALEILNHKPQENHNDSPKKR